MHGDMSGFYEVRVDGPSAAIIACSASWNVTARPLDLAAPALS